MEKNGALLLNKSYAHCESEPRKLVIATLAPRTGRINPSGRLKFIPQGLKPSSFRACFGAPEVVPFQIAIYATRSSSYQLESYSDLSAEEVPNRRCLLVRSHSQSAENLLQGHRREGRVQYHERGVILSGNIARSCLTLT
jgi:hypothetical protein